MVSDLTSYGEMGGEYLETWEFTDDDHYVWTLFTTSGAERVQVMAGTYERRPE